MKEEVPERPEGQSVCDAWVSGWGFNWIVLTLRNIPSQGIKHVDGEFWKGVSDILEQISIMNEEVQDILEHINMDRSPGFDDIYFRLLQEVKEGFAGTPGEISAFLLVTDDMQSDCRIANVIQER